MRLSVTGAYLAVPVWTNPDNWNKYRFTVRSGDRLIYTFRIPEETEKNSGTCDYHAYLPVDDLTGGETDVEMDTDAILPTDLYLIAGGMIKQEFIIMLLTVH